MDMLGRSLVFLGIFITALGALFLLAPHLPIVGRLPGDFSFQRGGFSLFLPIATSIVLSIALTIALNIAIRVFDR